jgi:HD-GYP domain-containing protein (c-di-GMP phosphodiesterase class II)
MPAVYVAASTSERLSLLRAALIVDAPAVASLEHARGLVGAEADVTLIIDAHVSWARAFVGMLPEDSTCSVVIAADDVHMGEVPGLLRDGADGFIALPSDPLIVATAVEAGRQTRARRRASSTEITAVRSQLLKVAEDFRFSYQRERARSRELAAYLGRIETSYRDTVRSLANAVEAKDPSTGAHIERVTEVANALTRLVDPELAARPYLSFGFLLHDVGKIGVPDEVLLKPGPLTDAETERMRAHALIGAHIIGEVEFLKPVLPIIRHHHERWDGRGYPDGLAGEDIPKAARIFAVADAVDAMIHDRPYRKACSLADAREEISACSGTQFDPTVVQAFLMLSVSEDFPLRALASDDASR